MEEITSFNNENENESVLVSDLLEIPNLPEVPYFIVNSLRKSDPPNETLHDEKNLCDKCEKPKAPIENFCYFCYRSLCFDCLPENITFHKCNICQTGWCYEWFSYGHGFCASNDRTNASFRRCEECGH